ncbi:MCE family protein [Tomitella biformata]|uniref:MCE family protein n=1 Tax=Tomitella biformata TaxID=630403 RepID=UPI000464D19D|nr:MCE family protein [Tomitella biformata]
MTGRHKLLAAALGLLLLAAISYAWVPRATTTEVTALFSSTTGLYKGDDVRIMGVRVGEITSITPAGDLVEVAFEFDDAYPAPADAQALIVSQSLVSARFIQLTPAYTGGPRLAPGALIPPARTASPVEWDEMKAQLARLAQDLGPDPGQDSGPLGEVVDALDENLAGQGQSLRQTLDTLSAALRTLDGGSEDLFGMVGNLRVFVSALAGSSGQITAFNENMAVVSGILASNGPQLETTLAELDVALRDVESFVRDNRGQLTSSVAELAGTVDQLAAQRAGLAQILHVAPTALSNLTNIYQPAHNAVVSALALSNFANPANFICSGLAAAEQVGPERGAQLCVEELGPVLRLLTTAYPPIASNPTRGVGALPDQLVYSEPHLALPLLPPARETTSVLDLLTIEVPE